MILTKNEVSRLLRPDHTIDHTNFEYIFMTQVTKKIQVLGYYDKHNTGDDCFKVVFQWIADRYCPGVELIFSNPYDIQRVCSRQLIIGGGDIINPYFVNRIRQCMQAGEDYDVSVVSVGTPYLDCVTTGYLNFAKRVWTRNQCDIDFLKKTTYGQVKYFPDIVHLLPRILPSPPLRPDNTGLSVGFCLTRTMYNKEFEMEYFRVVRKFAQVIHNLIIKEGVQTVTLIPFGIDVRNDSENDCKLHEHLITLLPEDIVQRHVNVVELSKDNFDYTDPSKYARYVDQLISHQDFVVCARFHAHVFCMNRNIPFVSVSTTRKVRQLLDQWNVSNWKFDLKVSEYFSPIDFDENALVRRIRNDIDRRSEMRIQLEKWHDDVISPSLEEFVEEFSGILNE